MIPAFIATGLVLAWTLYQLGRRDGIAEARRELMTARQLLYENGLDFDLDGDGFQEHIDRVMRSEALIRKESTIWRPRPSDCKHRGACSGGGLCHRDLNEAIAAVPPP